MIWKACQIKSGIYPNSCNIWNNWQAVYRAISLVPSLTLIVRHGVLGTDGKDTRTQEAFSKAQDEFIFMGQDMCWDGRHFTNSIPCMKAGLLDLQFRADDRLVLADVLLLSTFFQDIGMKTYEVGPLACLWSRCGCCTTDHIQTEPTTESPKPRQLLFNPCHYPGLPAMTKSSCHNHSPWVAKHFRI